ncbi:MAG: radical SAM protein [Nanoarchaeota archaeon]|nr:radical SAM protein [Nanoarchaeota archaeon]
MVLYKNIFKTGITSKPLRAIMSSLSTFRHGPKASLPFKLKMECSSFCNLKCTMCPLSVGLKRKQGFLKFENFKKVFNQINPAYLNLTGIGETFMCPDLFKIVSYAKSKKAMVKLDTNGMLVTEENAKKILDTGIDVISTSIDSADKEIYKKIRVGGDLDIVKKNIKNLVKERDRRKAKTEIHMFSIIQSENIHELPDLIRLANEMGVDYMAASFVVTLGKNKNVNRKIFDYKDKGKIEKIVKEARGLIKKSKTEISMEPLFEYLTYKDKGKKNKEFYNENTPCYMPWYSTFITWDGWVNPCDFSCDNEIVFGNVFQEPFKKIWNNQKYRQFRINVLKNRNKIELCRGCSVDETYVEKEFNKARKIPFVKFLEYKP